MKKRLPKNICQVGETDGSPKILIEEYTISFLQEIIKKAKDPQYSMETDMNRKESDIII